MGASFMSGGGDLQFLRDGLAAVQKSFGPLGFSFNSLSAVATGRVV